jgi:Family of unknown function (DUF6236)
MAYPNFRGVVLGSSWRFKKDNWFVSGQGVRELRRYQGQRWAADALLRRSLLYFDRVVWPTNNILPQGTDPGVEFLVTEGEVQLEHVEIAPLFPTQIQLLQGQSDAFPNKFAVMADSPNGKIAETVGQFHRSVYDLLDKQQPGAWNYAMVGDGVEFANETTVRGYSMELYKCLPVPAEGVSYKQIVAFKKTEKNALLDLRGNLGKMYRRIDSCDDKAFAALDEVTKLQRSVAAVKGLLTKSKIQYLRESVSVDLTGTSVKKALGAVATGVVATFSGAPVVAALGGAALATAWCVVKIKDIQSRETSAGTLKLKYIYKAGEAGIIDPSGPNDETT